MDCCIFQHRNLVLCPSRLVLQKNKIFRISMLACVDLHNSQVIATPALLRPEWVFHHGNEDTVLAYRSLGIKWHNIFLLILRLIGFADFNVYVCYSNCFTGDWTIEYSVFYRILPIISLHSEVEWQSDLLRIIFIVLFICSFICILQPQKCHS